MTGERRFEVLPSGESGEVYRAIKAPLAFVRWKDGYPVITYRRGETHIYAEIGGHVIANIAKFPPAGRTWTEFPWEWYSVDSLKPVRASGYADTLKTAKLQIERTMQVICGAPRP